MLGFLWLARVSCATWVVVSWSGTNASGDCSDQPAGGYLSIIPMATRPTAPPRQVNWMRYITGMSHREEFKYATELADSAMTVIYLLLGIVACKTGLGQPAS